MKVILLASTGGNNFHYFPFWIRRPKHLYHVQGQVQLKRLIDQILEAGFKQGDIEIVVGFQYKKIVRFLEDNHYHIKIKINHHWRESSSYTLLTALEGVNEDFILFCADTYANAECFRYIANCPMFFNSEALKLNKKHITLVKKIAKDYIDKKGITNESSFFELRDINLTQPAHTGSALFYILLIIVQNIDGSVTKKSHIPQEILDDGYDDFDTIYEMDEYKSGHFIYRLAVHISIRVMIYSELTVELFLNKDKSFKQKIIHIIRFIKKKMKKNTMNTKQA